MESAEAIIRQEISEQGAISVARFIELALYHPEYGYYRRPQDPFGRAGDFYTAEQLQPVFGELMASYVEKLASAWARELAFSVLEIGAGRGEMRSALSRWNYQAYDWNERALPATMRGLILANEFFDALPVHLLRRDRDEWTELGVSLRDRRFVLAPIAPADAAVRDYAGRYGEAVPDCGLLEVNLEAGAWVQTLSRIQHSGELLIVDYGYDAGELARFGEGTLMTYRRHAPDADFLSDPGTRDITAHVNFSYLKDLAAASGYLVASDCTLKEWMTDNWDERQLALEWQRRNADWKLQWKHLFFGMGETFRVLALHRRDIKEKAPED